MTKLLNFHLHCTEERLYCPHLNNSLQAYTNVWKVYSSEYKW